MAHTWMLIVPVLSTTHLKPGTLDWLQAHAQTAPYREGVFVNMMSFTDSDHPQELSALQEWLAFVYPDENWIRFDADGDVIDTLPTFDEEPVSLASPGNSPAQLPALIPAQAQPDLLSQLH